MSRIYDFRSGLDNWLDYEPHFHKVAFPSVSLLNGFIILKHLIGIVTNTPKSGTVDRRHYSFIGCQNKKHKAAVKSHQHVLAIFRIYIGPSAAQLLTLY